MEIVLLPVDNNVVDQGPVSRLVSAFDEPKDGGVVCIFDDAGAILGEDTVVCVQGEESGAEAAALW